MSSQHTSVPFDRRSSSLHHHAPFPEASTSQSSSRRPPPRRIITTSSRFPSTLVDTTLFDRNGYMLGSYTAEAERVRALPAQSTQWGIPLLGALRRHPDGSEHENIEFISPASPDSSVTVLAPLPPSAFRRTTGATRPPPQPEPLDGLLPSKAERCLDHLLPLLTPGEDSSDSSRSSSASSRSPSPPNRAPTPSTRAPSPFTGGLPPSTPAPSLSFQTRSPATEAPPRPPRDPASSTPVPFQPIETNHSPLFRSLPPLPVRPRFVVGSSTLTAAPQPRLSPRVRFDLPNAPLSTSAPSSTVSTPAHSSTPAPPTSSLTPSQSNSSPPAPASRRPSVSLQETLQLPSPSRLPSPSSASVPGFLSTSQTHVKVPSTSSVSPPDPTHSPASKLEVEGFASQGALAPVSTTRIRRSNIKRLDSESDAQIDGGYLTRSKRKRQAEVPAEPVPRPLEFTKPPPKGKVKATTRRRRNVKIEELPTEPSTSRSKKTTRSRSNAPPKAAHSSRRNASIKEKVLAEPALVRRKVGRPSAKGKGKDAGQMTERSSSGLGPRAPKAPIQTRPTTSGECGSKKDDAPSQTSRYLTRSKRKRDAEEAPVEADFESPPSLLMLIVVDDTTQVDLSLRWTLDDSCDRKSKK
ncbi:hypothetical protein Pst134EB_022176 [Puccinia striiformis f. sp. tritici]|nr:hypothetical protein Pst134EB_022176 [Puccinia striiformis f. sp. tritici]